MAYRVKRQFTDRHGKAHKAGDPFGGTRDEIDEQLAAGNVEEIDDMPPPSTGKQSGEGGGAPA